MDQVYRSCLVTLGGYKTWVYLIISDMVDFDVILGMDWLFLYDAILDYYAKIVTNVLPKYNIFGAKT